MPWNGVFGSARRVCNSSKGDIHRAPALRRFFSMKVRLLLLALFSVTLCAVEPARSPQRLKSLSLEQLGNLEVTTVSKQPEVVWDTPAAIYVITQNDIRRSGATSLPELLRMIPGVQVSP